MAKLRVDKVAPGNVVWHEHGAVDAPELVPYIGADGNVNLGTFNLSTNTVYSPLIQSTLPGAFPLTFPISFALPITPLVLSDGNNTFTFTDGDVHTLRYFYSGTNDDMLIGYDGTDGIIDTGVVNPSDLIIDCGTDKTLELADTVWDDWQGQLSTNQATNPSAHIVFNHPEASVTFKTNCDTGDYIYMNPQMQHAWKLGTAIHPHIHWWQTTAAQPNWLVQYRWQRNGQAKTTAWTNFALTTNAFTWASGTLCQITGDPSGITPPTGYSISDIIQMRIIRDVANTSGAFSGGAESSSVDADAVSVDFHYEIDTMGSRQEFVK